MAPAALMCAIDESRPADVRWFMKKRMVIMLAAIAALILLTASFQRLQPTQQLTVYDADGRKVGPIAGAEWTFGVLLPLVSLKIDGVPMMLFVFRDSFVGHVSVVWESTNCSGTPFLPTGDEDFVMSKSPLPFVGVGVPGNTVYVEDSTVNMITVRSYSTMPLNGPRDRPALPPRCEQASAPFTRRSLPAKALLDLNTQFKPPFSVR